MVGDDAEQAVNKISNKYGQDVRRIAVELAKADELLTVDPKHVMEAHSLLKQRGLRRGFLQPDMLVGVGSLLIGVADKADHFASWVAEDWFSRPLHASEHAFAIGVAVVGTLLVLLGIFLNRSKAEWRRV